MRDHSGKNERYLDVFNTHTQSSTGHSDHFILLESLKCRQNQIKELSNFINKKISEIPKSESQSHLALICGDFNVNSLPESEDVKEMILRQNPRNQEFIDASH